ncbi:uncharacterized protein MYCGRDRAFT_97932 [Zymoseptoria tritici IPO323]|uniref:Uncharacterized protein n=1 Tax=Zymoseptoria tritici (strain CBS 115943 / IPO323) TaxID=336722 RepID=F9XRT9_ZYMTI|nr:uncharacterized protein MYCGRDRAFT_97932 [Zymoseptoria tritici IPO323]EGP82038.1 hypothetical protein MYCGRDRAFT_97932 [Zymoseptoria tritici IPO323]
MEKTTLPRTTATTQVLRLQILKTPLSARPDIVVLTTLLSPPLPEDIEAQIINLEIRTDRASSEVRFRDSDSSEHDSSEHDSSEHASTEHDSTRYDSDEPAHDLEKREKGYSEGISLQNNARRGTSLEGAIVDEQECLGRKLYLLEGDADYCYLQEEDESADVPLIELEGVHLSWVPHRRSFVGLEALSWLSGSEAGGLQGRIMLKSIEHLTGDVDLGWISKVVPNAQG